MSSLTQTHTTFPSNLTITFNIYTMWEEPNAIRVAGETWELRNTSTTKYYYTLTRPDGSTYNGSISGRSSGESWNQLTYDLSAAYWDWTVTKTHSQQTVVKMWYLDFYTNQARTTRHGKRVEFTLTMYVSPKTSYAVSYNGNGSTGGSTSPQTKWYGETLALQANGYTRTNYVFKNWNTAANGSGTSYSAGANYTANSGATLYAQWYAPYTITPNANGGTLASGCGNLVKVYNTAKTLWASSLNPTRTNYTFAGWNTNSAGTGTNYAAGATYPASANANATLYAKWTQIYASPQLSINNAYRCDSSGTAADEGSSAAVKCNVKIWKTSTTNTCSVTAKVREKGSTGEWQTASVTPTLTDASGSTWREANDVTLVITTAAMATDKQYDVEVSVTDTQGGVSGKSDATTTKAETIGTAFYTIDVLEGGHGICFGGVAKDDVFEVDMPAVFTCFAGVIQMYAGATPPLGWLKCEGQAVSRAEYPALFAAIGTTWGAGNGTTTFNLPDLRGRAPIGAGTGSGLTARTLGTQNVGAETHSHNSGKTGSTTLSAAQSGLPAHTHAFTQPTLTTKLANIRATGNLGMPWYSSGGGTRTDVTTASGGAVGAVTGGAKAATSGHDHAIADGANMQPSAVVNFIICTGATS